MLVSSGFFKLSKFHSWVIAPHVTFELLKNLNLGKATVVKKPGSLVKPAFGVGIILTYPNESFVTAHDSVGNAPHWL